MAGLPALPTDRNRLAPEDAYLNRSFSDSIHSSNGHVNGNGTRSNSARRNKDRRRTRSRSRRRKTTWKKLLWVKQSFPDNYTDEETFLDALQRNPRLRLYEFWPLVADSTIIVQQVCTMILFVCCFSGIFTERVSPFTVVGIGSACTVMGWILWDKWVGEEEAAKEIENKSTVAAKEPTMGEDFNGIRKSSSTSSFRDSNYQGLGFKSPPTSSTPRRGHSRQSSSGSMRLPTLGELHQKEASQFPTPGNNATAQTPPVKASSTPTTRNQQRLLTAKSSVLICGALLGLSPILKSLTQSTASDSIWAISFWLMCINVIFFDYGGGVGATFPASLSTNAALMASTVLASRLKSTAHVFSLTLFSIQVFGLFPVFRRYLRHISWNGHLALTWLLVMGSGAGVTMSLSGGGWPAAVFGAVFGSLLTGLAMGICSWWLIGLQRYKNEIHGPWDPARPVLRRWD